MINARERIYSYRKSGFLVEQGFAQPDSAYEVPARGERAILYTVAGSLLLTMADGTETKLLPDSEMVITSTVGNVAVAGEKGWKFVVAWNPAETAEQKTQVE